MAPSSSKGSTLVKATEPNTSESSKNVDEYGKDIKDIPRSVWKLLTNKIYLVTCLGACMELIIVSGFIVFLPKYLETQFNLSKSMASMFTGGIAIPGNFLPTIYFALHNKGLTGQKSFFESDLSVLEVLIVQSVRKFVTCKKYQTRREPLCNGKTDHSYRVSKHRPGKSRAHFHIEMLKIL